MLGRGVVVEPLVLSSFQPFNLQGVAPLKSYEMQGIAVTTRDVAKLLPGQWVNDEVVNYFLHRLWWAISETRPALSSRIGVFQSFAFRQLTRVWGESADLPGDYISQYASEKSAHLVGYCAETFWDCDVLLFPVNKEDQHWTLLMVCNPGKSNCCMMHLDSLSQTQSEQSTFASSLVRGFLTAEWERAERGEGPDFSKVPCFHESVPQQDNGNDCGPFVCYFAEHVVSILSDMPMTEQLDVVTFRAAVRQILKPDMVQYRFDLMAFFFSTIVVRYTQPSKIESLQACINAAKAACQGFPSHPTMWSTLPVPPKRVPVRHKRGRSGAAPAGTPPTALRQTRARTGQGDGVAFATALGEQATVAVDFGDATDDGVDGIIIDNISADKPFH